MSSRLSVCLLTRNDAHQIERAVGSVIGMADEVIVADTGSTDRTTELAQALGARVLPFTWADDFAEGRNFAIGQANGGWILWLNPDEELLPADAGSLRALIDSDDNAFGWLARVLEVARADRPDQFSETWDLRLFRNRPDLRYVGRVHPSLAPELASAVAAEGRSVARSEVVIRRHAYASVLDEAKLRWAVRLLEKELQDRPGVLHSLIEYGRNLLLLKDPKGHEVMAEAIEQVLPTVGAAAPPSPDVQVLLEYAINTPAERYRGRLTREQAMELAPRWFPGSPPLLWALAETYFRAGQHRAALVLLERLVQLGQTGTYDHSHGFDPRIIGNGAVLNLGRCYQALGVTAEARRCFEWLLQDREYAEQASKALADLDGGT